MAGDEDEEVADALADDCCGCDGAEGHGGAHNGAADGGGDEDDEEGGVDGDAVDAADFFEERGCG